MISAVIFDLNGVFLESERLSDRYAATFGIAPEDFLPALKEIMNQVRKPQAPGAYSLWKPYLDKWGVNLTEKEFFDFWFSGEHLVPELLDYARELKKKGLKIFIISNNFKERTTFYRNNFSELFSTFDKVYFSWETGYIKSEKDAYLNLLKENSLEPSECIFFDDSENNVELAKSLGIDAFLYKGLDEVRQVLSRHV